MPSKIVERIVSESGIPRLFSALAEDLSPSDLQSLLLAAYRARSADLRESDVLAHSERSGLFGPSNVDARALNEFERVTYQAAQQFTAIELSPVCPLGASHVLGSVDQNNVLTTIRNAELLGDATTALAIECAHRRKEAAKRGDPTPVRLCASHRALRLQPFEMPGYSAHFRLFCLVSAGRDSGSFRFELDHLREHIDFYLRLLRDLNTRGFHLAAPLVEISDPSLTRLLLTSAGVTHEELRASIQAHHPGGSEEFLRRRGIVLPAGISDPAADLPGLPTERLMLVRERVFADLRTKYPEAEFRFNLARLEGLAYYAGLCLRISPAAVDGERYPVIDGGFTDWTARLLQNKKERLLTSGIGSEFACRRYRNPA